MQSDRGRFSLESFLTAKRMEDLLAETQKARIPVPASVFDELRRQWVEWPPLLSITFPDLREWDEKIVRLAEGHEIEGVEPAIAPGSLLLVEDRHGDAGLNLASSTSGWARPLYAIRQGVKHILGHLNKDGDQYALLSSRGGEAKIVFRKDEMASLRRVTGVAVPI